MYFRANGAKQYLWIICISIFVQRPVMINLKVNHKLGKVTKTSRNKPIAWLIILPTGYNCCPLFSIGTLSAMTNHSHCVRTMAWHWLCRCTYNKKQAAAVFVNGSVPPKSCSTNSVTINPRSLLLTFNVLHSHSQTMQKEDRDTFFKW